MPSLRVKNAGELREGDYGCPIRFTPRTEGGPTVQHGKLLSAKHGGVVTLMEIGFVDGTSKPFTIRLEDEVTLVVND